MADKLEDGLRALSKSLSVGTKSGSPMIIESMDTIMEAVKFDTEGRFPVHHPVDDLIAKNSRLSMLNRSYCK